MDGNWYTATVTGVSANDHFVVQLEQGGPEEEVHYKCLAYISQRNLRDWYQTDLRLLEGLTDISRPESWLCRCIFLEIDTLTTWISQALQLLEQVSLDESASVYASTESLPVPSMLNEGTSAYACYASRLEFESVLFLEEILLAKNFADL